MTIHERQGSDPHPHYGAYGNEGPETVHNTKDEMLNTRASAATGSADVASASPCVLNQSDDNARPARIGSRWTGTAFVSGLSRSTRAIVPPPSTSSPW